MEENQIIFIIQIILVVIAGVILGLKVLIGVGFCIWANNFMFKKKEEYSMVDMLEKKD